MEISKKKISRFHKFQLSFMLLWWSPFKARSLTHLFQMFVNPFCESLLLNGIAFV